MRRGGFHKPAPDYRDRSEAVIPPIDGVKEGLESKSVLTNREILDLQVIPEHLVVIGGGVIARLEMAGYFRPVALSSVRLSRLIISPVRPTVKWLGGSFTKRLREERHRVSL